MGKCEDSNRKCALRAAGGNRTVNTVSLQWKLFPSGVMPIGLFASMGQMGVGVGIPPPPNSGDEGQRQIRRLVAAAELSSNAQETKDLGFGLSGKYLPSPGGEFGFKAMIPQTEIVSVEADDAGQRLKKKLKRRGLKLRVGNAALKRLLSGAFSGAVSRTAVAPLETIRTHLMVGSSGKSMTEVFNHIMHNEGWQGLFRGNGVNVIRVAPSKAIELFAYDTVKKFLTPKPGETPRIPFSVSPVAGAAAGVCSTLCTYPLELLKTRMTIQMDSEFKYLLYALLSKEIDGTISLQVSGKNTNTDRYLHAYSHHQCIQKIAILNTLVTRALWFSDNNHLNSEKTHIRRALLSNGYSKAQMERSFQKATQA